MTPRIRTSEFGSRLFAALMLLAVGATAAGAQGAPPRPARATPDSIVLPAQAPSPALHAPTGAAAVQQRATSAPVAPVSPGSPPPKAPAAPVPAASVAPQQPNAGPPPRLQVETPTAAPAASIGPSTPPPGATMRCKDGTYLSGPPLAANCAGRGGVAVIIPPPPPPPPAPIHNR